MELIGAFEGKTHFARLLREVSEGKTFVITKNGKPVAQLGPIPNASLTPAEAVERILARKVSLGMPIAEAIAEGRRRNEPPGEASQ